MITAADSEYHLSEPSVDNWAETIVMMFSVPEAGILGNAYVLSRPNVGAATSAVTVHSGFCTQPYQLDFVDPRMHMPAPEKFSDFSLPSGLSLKVTDAPRDFEITYEHELGACRLDLKFKGLHDPFDTHDPKQNPLALADGDAGETGFGDAWATGHFDMVGHVTGTLELRGRTYEVDCVEGMDRSWGPRKELGDRAVSYLHVTLGTDFAVHVVMSIDYRDGQLSYDGFRFGYLVEDGELIGLVDAKMSARHVDMLMVSNHIVVTDARGRTFEFHGTAVGGAPWYSYIPAYVSFQSLMRYEYRGRVGYAECTDVIGTEYLAERMSRHGRLQTVTSPPAWPTDSRPSVGELQR